MWPTISPGAQSNLWRYISEPRFHTVFHRTGSDAETVSLAYQRVLQYQRDANQARYFPSSDNVMFPHLMLSKISGEMNNITANGIKTGSGHTISVLQFSPGTVQPVTLGFNTFWRHYFSLLLLFGCPDFFCRRGTERAVSPWVITITNSFRAITFRAKITVF